MAAPKVLRLLFKPGIIKHFRFEKDKNHLIVEETLTSEVNCVPKGAILVKYGDEDLRGKSEEDLISIRAKNRPETRRTLLFFLPGCAHEYLDRNLHKKVKKFNFSCALKSCQNVTKWGSVITRK